MVNGSADARVSFRWLGVAGLELRTAGRALLVDPYLTRLPLHRLWFGRVEPDRALVRQIVEQADFVLVTHAHFDHLFDVPEVVRQTGAIALGSPNVCRLLSATGVPAGRVREIGAGDRLTLGDCTVEVLPAQHLTVFKRPLLVGSLPVDLKPPLRAWDFRMDACFSFLIEVSGIRLLDWTSERTQPAVPADGLLVKAGKSADYYCSLLAAVRPRFVVPVHWDDYFRPLSRPPRPLLLPPAWDWPPLRWTDLAAFRRTVERLAPGTQVRLPQALRAYDVGDLL